MSTDLQGDLDPESQGRPESPASLASPADPVRTGVDGVDEVIRAVEELEERPLEEHVGVFEAAQTRLRQALDDRGGSDDVPTD